MGLRTSTALKLFAILLFSFEMIAPALISSAQNETSQEIKFVSNDNHFNNSLASLFEENSEEGRESKDHKGAIAFIDTCFYKSYGQFAISERRQISWDGLQSTASQPSLVTLFHTYLI